MISKNEKTYIIRERLIITYKDNIVNDLNRKIIKIYYFYFFN